MTNPGQAPEDTRTPPQGVASGVGASTHTAATHSCFPAATEAELEYAVARSLSRIAVTDSVLQSY